jgi:hypothetical protein
MLRFQWKGKVAVSCEDDMKQKRSTLGGVIGLAAIISLAYLASVLFAAHDGLIFGLFGLSLLATIWMALKILKDPYSTEQTFDDQFYQDRDDLRRNVTE